MTAILDYTSYLIIYVVAIPSHLNMLCSIEGYVEFTSRSSNHTCSCYHVNKYYNSSSIPIIILVLYIARLNIE